MNTDFMRLLLGKDLRSIGRANEVVKLVHDQQSFDELFGLLLHHERALVMRAADAIEKIVLQNPQFLVPHRKQLLALMRGAMHKELKWHIALLLSRLDLSDQELPEVWDVFAYWAQNPHESRIVRVNSLQALFELSSRHQELLEAFVKVVAKLEHEPIPSLQARIGRLKKALKVRR